MKRVFLAFVLLFAVVAAYLYFSGQSPSEVVENVQKRVDEGGPLMEPHPLSIDALRDGEYPGGELVVEQELPSGSNYSREIVSYTSEGLKIYALLTVPSGTPPEGGWPVVIFNHGYIPPDQYRTTERYVAYTDAFSRNGYVLLRPDYRGHGNSEGDARGGYSNNDYTIDVLNAVASIKRDSRINPEKIGMWGHSMGGYITLRNMVVRDDVKAGVIWGGVVASYPDLLENWRRRRGDDLTPFPTRSTRGGWRQDFLTQYGSPAENPTFWNSISSNAYLGDVSGPIQLHHGEADTSVPYEFSVNLHQELEEAGKESELYTYPGDDHDITSNFGIAAQRSVEFFDRYLKE